MDISLCSAKCATKECFRNQNNPKYSGLSYERQSFSDFSANCPAFEPDDDGIIDNTPTIEDKQ